MSKKYSLSELLNFFRLKVCIVFDFNQINPKLNYQKACSDDGLYRIRKIRILKQKQ